jgi:hypothetical protein
MRVTTDFTARAAPAPRLVRSGPFCDWRTEIAEAIAPARVPHASIWERSRAVRELERILMPRLREERARTAALEDRIDPRTRERLWAVGELVELLYEALVQDVQVPLRGATFASELEALLRAVDRWCEEAELASRLAERS